MKFNAKSTERILAEAKRAKEGKDAVGIKALSELK